jgi:hypothetical protein
MQCPNCDKTTFFIHKGVCLACAELGVIIKKKNKYNPTRFSKKVIAKTYNDNPGKASYHDYLKASREDYAREHLRRKYATNAC